MCAPFDVWALAELAPLVSIQLTLGNQDAGSKVTEQLQQWHENKIVNQFIGQVEQQHSHQ